MIANVKLYIFPKAFVLIDYQHNTSCHIIHLLIMYVVLNYFAKISL